MGYIEQILAIGLAVVSPEASGDVEESSDDSSDMPTILAAALP